MSLYREKYEQVTGRTAPAEADNLEQLFTKIATGELLPPRGQQAVDVGLTAHSLNDPYENRPIYDYYHWVLENIFNDQSVNELSAKLIGMAFTCANIFQTDLPQPLTLNPWQISALRDYPLATQRAVIVENNGVFIWLAKLHPDWPLINQGGNDFNDAYVALIQSLEARHVQFTYLGDLDSQGIKIADNLFRKLKRTTIQRFTALQSPTNVSKWLSTLGKVNPKRTQFLTIHNPVLREELDSIHLFGVFVEQEQLIAEYERLIAEWLGDGEQ
ncbi:DUF2399 domain-containing protein [Levilactobacillus tujiorum]|uniref:DUF2399 domain-containing protein n=1 Tax=Levilactobacillus tujiorum TaxID=2912243 RepID=A0ABX1L5A4_9LACO|nr:DUF2399 domain-containing protein [Levilactobacillus tujiorum]MCH5464802.1 DUF2399 domain-containing protein [Levilactobacillus tujiorum]NLR11900.1 DUF2399 domain-containing protein [Lactobacillus sp. HBUAS51387]NLR29838.1 DUF2399 domain-containing protein [Levilactobacillus tujiorum]